MTTRIKRLAVAIPVIAAVAGLAFWFSPERIAAAKVRGYQAVLLDNNSVYFGKMADLGVRLSGAHECLLHPDER